MLDKALYYANEHGLSVIPVHSVKDGKCSCGAPKCSAPGKHPRLKWKAQTKTPLTDAELRDWWERYPDSNVGIVTGAISGIAVIDIDGEEGIEALRDAGLPVDELPLSPTVRTGSGGLHIYLRYPEIGEVRTGAGILPKVDIRGDGGFVVAPPSVHHSGGSYTWLKGRSIEDVDPADFDFGQLVSTADTNSSEESVKIAASTKWFEKHLMGVKEGGRNEAAARLAGRYYGMGLTLKEVQVLLHLWNLNNEPPINEEELKRTIRSIYDREQGSHTHERDDLIERINNALRLKINSVKRITGDEPQVIIEFDEGTCYLSTPQLLSPKGLQQAVAEATKVIVRKLSSKTTPSHEQLAQMIMDVAEDVDAGVEATGVGELMVLLRDYLSNQRMIPLLEADDPIPEHGSFRDSRCVWVNLMDLVQRSGSRWGMRVPIRQMAQRLRGLGVERRVFETPEGSQRIMWGLDAKRIGWAQETEREEEQDED